MILILHAVVNIFTSHLVAIFNSISVFWHVIGVAAIVVVLIFVPDQPPERRRSSSPTGSTTPGFSHAMFWWYVLPLGFLLTQYTITGYDASAHISEETHEAADQRREGVWQSIFYSAMIGWVVLLALTFAATHRTSTADERRRGHGRSRCSRAR